MGILLEQFVTATRKFQNRLPQPERERRESSAVFWTMHYTGGSVAMKRLEPLDKSKLSWDERCELSVADIEGYHSIEQMQSYLSSLMSEVLILETFLIPSLVRALDAEFQYWVDTYEHRVAGRQEKIKEIRDIEADPEKRKIHLEAAREVHAQFVAEGKLPPEPFDEESYFKRQIDLFERVDTFSPNEKENSELRLTLWREVSKDILTAENLERAKEEELNKWREAAEDD